MWFKLSDVFPKKNHPKCGGIQKNSHRNLGFATLQCRWKKVPSPETNSSHLKNRVLPKRTCHLPTTPFSGENLLLVCRECFKENFSQMNPWIPWDPRSGSKTHRNKQIQVNLPGNVLVFRGIQMETTHRFFSHQEFTPKWYQTPNSLHSVNRNKTLLNGHLFFRCLGKKGCFQKTSQFLLN